MYLAENESPNFNSSFNRLKGHILKGNFKSDLELNHHTYSYTIVDCLVARTDDKYHNNVFHNRFIRRISGKVFLSSSEFDRLQCYS